MEFLSWHYSEGIRYYIKSCIDTVHYVVHTFSPMLLLETLFAPYKRIIVADSGPGFDIKRKFEAMTFNFVSRFIGFFVRLVLIASAGVLVVISIIGGIAGFFFWLLIPLLGVSVYQRKQRQPEHVVKNILEKLQSSDQPVRIIFDNEAGRFVLTHLGITREELESNALPVPLSFHELPITHFKELADFLVSNNVWSRDFFYSHGITSEDLLVVCDWWDKKAFASSEIVEGVFGRPGMALELTYGYTPTLNHYITDLAAPQPFSHHLIGRGEIVNRIERTLTSGQSIFLTGEAGVGKKTVIFEFAHRAANGLLGEDMSYKRILEFDYNAFLSGSTDVNQKKSELSQVLAEAAYAGNVILVIRDIHRILSSVTEGYDFTDVFEPLLEKRELKIIAVSSNSEYEQYLAPNSRMKKFFEKIEITVPTKTEAFEILLEQVTRSETTTNLLITYQGVKQMLDKSDEYITDTPFPEKVLELLDACITFVRQQNKKTLDIQDVNTVLAEKTGISFVSLDAAEKGKLGNIEELIHERLVNQSPAVSLIAKTLRAKTVGVVSEKRPIGSFLFLGPTGVGKTETAKVLARVYFGSEDAILRFDMSEYSSNDGLDRLIGSVSRNTPGILTTAIKNKPAGLLLLDEIEKASPEIYNIFLTLLDEGYITDSFGKRINCKNLFVIGTSNAGAEFIRQLVESQTPKEAMQKQVANYILERGIFSPEFINRFDGVVVYEPLSEEHLFEIAKHMLSDLGHNLEGKNIHLTWSDDVLIKLAKDGFDPAFGARPMRRIVNLDIGDILGRAILSDEIQSGNTIKLTAYDDFGWEKV
jgi:ATP-dependent Clp protease ATP-binding subunit ClpA